MNMEFAYRAILDRSKSGIYIVTPDRTIIYWNKGAEAITGYAAQEIVGKHCPETLLRHIDSAGHPLCELNCPLLETVVTGQERTEMMTLRHKDGYRIPVRMRLVPIRQNGRVEMIAEIFERISDVTYDDNMISSLSYQLLHDSLTKLPNRDYLRRYLKYRMSEYLVFGHNYAVLVADIDRLGDFNDKYGHAYGDELLEIIGKEIQTHIRQSDLVGRLEGGRFMGIYTFAHMEDLRIIGRKFSETVSKIKIMAGQEEISATVSVGVTAIEPNDTIDTVTLRAETMMKRSKAEGKNRVITDLDGFAGV